MAKYLIDGNALDNLAAKLQQISVLFDAIDDEMAQEVRASVMCSIGLDIVQRTEIELGELRMASRVEVSA
ncbi:hypothetical protein [Burkholderia ubonensis]|uniref:hypothetical protein n=1 Tax=Burkholderia ubonensis TaxID=101571 RepID=UPI000756BC2F|nr:hypothetical protein [Burkholderia ubonensis]KVN81093.1 hypothetical protein WJ67_06505 [Burkholderia ubonensis]